MKCPECQETVDCFGCRACFDCGDQCVCDLYDYDENE
jgi:hypothetical protein